MGRKSGATKGGRTIHPTDALRMCALVVERVVLRALAVFSCLFLIRGLWERFKLKLDSDRKLIFLAYR
jgi:hypothetical protein